MPRIPRQAVDAGRARDSRVGMRNEPDTADIPTLYRDDVSGGVGDECSTAPQNSKLSRVSLF